MPPGFKRSRALWNETKDGGIRAWINAICYELQPIRLSKSSRKEALATLLSLVQNIISLILGIPLVCKAILIFISHRSLRHWTVVGALFVYYWVIRWIHEALDAGPVVLILTALTLIFTIGLSDDDNRSGLSAYAVFNRGFEQLLGSVDADSLLAQHVGGGLMMNMNQQNDAADHQPDRDNAAPPNRPRFEEEDNHREVANEEAANADDERRDANDHNDNKNNRARKSGKKARRRNPDQRQELRRQREAAMRIGMDGVHDGANDVVEIQRIIEEQIAAENIQR